MVSGKEEARGDGRQAGVSWSLCQDKAASAPGTACLRTLACAPACGWAPDVHRCSHPSAAVITCTAGMPGWVRHARAPCVLPQAGLLGALGLTAGMLLETVLLIVRSNLPPPLEKKFPHLFDPKVSAAR